MGNTILKTSTSSWFSREHKNQSLVLPLFHQDLDLLDYDRRDNRKSLVRQLVERRADSTRQSNDPRWFSRTLDFFRRVFAPKIQLPKALTTEPDESTLCLPLPEISPVTTTEEHFFDEFYEVYETESTRLRPFACGRSEDEEYEIAMMEMKMKATCCQCGDCDDTETASCTTDVLDVFTDDEASDSELGLSLDLDLSLDCDQHDDNDDENKSFEAQEREADRLIRMASSCAIVSVQLKDYLCLCGACPSLKRIVKLVHQSKVWVDTYEEKSLIRILLAFSVYNEDHSFDDDMIQSAKECLELWGGDEERAFRSFVILHDEVDYLCAMTPACDNEDIY